MKCTICERNMLMPAARLSENRHICGDCYKKLGGMLKFASIKNVPTDELRIRVLKDGIEGSSVQSNMASKNIVEYGKFLCIDQDRKIVIIPVSGISSNRKLKEAVAMSRKEGKIHKVINKKIPFDSILGAEIYEDGSAVMCGGLGSAAIGSALFGSTGAVVGAITGKKKVSNNCEKLQILVKVNDLSNPIQYIDILSIRTSKNSNTYTNAIEMAQKIAAALNIIAQQNN